MSLKSQITDGTGGKLSAAVDSRNNSEVQALVVATRPLKEFENASKFFSSDDYGVDMNVDASAGGTPDNVHNGTDNTYWTASDIVGGGKTTFNNAERPNTGSLAVKVDNSPVNDVYQFARGSSIDLSGYVSLVMWINVDKDWKNGDSISIYGWDTGLGAQVGNAVYLENYFPWGVFDTYHQITIPLSDLGLSTSTIDALRIAQISKEGKAPKYYLDDITIQETGVPVEYYIEADNDTYLFVDSLTFSIADAYTGVVTDGTMPDLPYDKFLGQTLNPGLGYKRISQGKTVFNVTINSLMDLMQFSDVTIDGYGSDGINSWLTVRVPFVEPLKLNPLAKDRLSITISENLTGLEHLRVHALGYTESRL